jgi:Asp-tRNA(Asn)/Glu-tRNA(Gln) amidotransferase C subunit
VTPEEVERLAALAGLRFPEEDLEPVAEALAEHIAFVQPLLRLDRDGDA